MTTLTRKLLLLVALLVLPLQGIATAAAFVKCHEQAAAQAATEASGHHHDGDDTSRHHHDGDENAPASSAGHLCGHFVVLHMPGALDIAMVPPITSWSLPALLSYTPHYPEHPRRPPRV